jgi:hypothetical protein
MRNCFVIGVCLLLSVHLATAQNATPNSGFENWTPINNYFNPDGWNNLNSNTAILGVLTCARVSASADVHSGTYAMKLTTRSVFGITANGIASTATLITTPPYGVTGGIPYTLRPDSITGWYKYNPASAADSGFFQFVLQGSAGDTIGFVKKCTPNTTVSTYTRFSAPITYFSSAAPTNSYWILSSSDGTNPVVNSALFVDDLALVFNTSSLSEFISQHEWSVYPNPVSDKIFLNINEPTQFSIIDINGRSVSTGVSDEYTNEIDVTSLVSGMYTIRLSNGESHSSRKFVKH